MRSLFLTKEVSIDSVNTLNDQFELKNISFMLVLLRVIMTAAFATDKTKSIEEAVKLVRKSSSVQEEDAQTLNKKKSTEVHLKSSNSSTIAENSLNQLMSDQFGVEILVSTDFKQLTAHLIALVS